MGKMQALLLATATQQGVLRVGAGLHLPAPGVIDAIPSLSDLWVDSGGDDTNGNGSITSPFATLSHAFAWAVAHPLASGYTVHLPAGNWQEHVGLPPPNTCLVGEGMLRTVLSDVAGAPLVWTEGVGDPGVRYFNGLWLVADVSGRDGGNIALVAFQCRFQSTLTLLGQLTMDGCDGDYSNLVNCSNVTVSNPRSTPSTSFNLSYDPLAGTNGPGAVYNEIRGGQWGGVQFNSQDPTVILYVLGARVSSGILAYNAANIQAISTSTPSLTANDAASEVGYDGPVNDVSPTFHGLGTFRNAELVLKKTVPMNYGTGDVTIPVPKQASVLPLKNVFVMVDLQMVDVTWVSSTASSITLHVIPTAALHPAYELRILVKP